MKKLISLLSLTVGMSLFAYTETLKPTRFDVEIEKNDDMKLKIDCSYKNITLFGNKEFSKDKDTNNFMNKLCEFNQTGASFEITYGYFRKILDNFIDEYSSFSISSDTKIKYLNKVIDYESLSKLKEQPLYYHLKLYKERLFSSFITIVLDIPIISLTNTTINVHYEYTSNKCDDSMDFDEEYLIKNYKYDPLNNKIENFEIDKQIKDNLNLVKTFTNNYNIDELSECINGDVWIKKYGAKSGDRCEWIKK